MITVKQGADVDIGANPSAEDQDEGVEDGAAQVNNVVYSHRLQSTVFDKKSYLVHLKVRTYFQRSRYILSSHLTHPELHEGRQG